MSSIIDQRKEFRGRPLNTKSVNPDPILQFESWFREARESGLPEPNAMSLATSDQNHQSSLRMVLLKAFDSSGFVFYTNYSSRKAKQLSENPKASALFPWVALARQVIIEGKVEKVSRSETIKYFATRPFGSQVGAWVSDQSQVISSRSILEKKWEEMKKKFKEGKVPVPDLWGGYRIMPDRIEFWQGQENRLHDRILYSRKGSEWIIERLAP
jgi:pyridoxamine 5'-phosphate oxidase